MTRKSAQISGGRTPCVDDTGPPRRRLQRSDPGTVSDSVGFRSSSLALVADPDECNQLRRVTKPGKQSQQASPHPPLVAIMTSTIHRSHAPEPSASLLRPRTPTASTASQPRRQAVLRHIRTEGQLIPPALQGKGAKRTGEAQKARPWRRPDADRQAKNGRPPSRPATEPPRTPSPQGVTTPHRPCCARADMKNPQPRPGAEVSLERTSKS